jgi:poly-beta-1,6-N-acetyl-D-glucosamine synthase
MSHAEARAAVLRAVQEVDAPGEPPRQLPMVLLAWPAITGLCLAVILFTFLPWYLLGQRESGAILPLVLAGFAALAGLRWTAFFTLSLWAVLDRRRRPAPRPSRWPRVSIFVPAMNESETIEPALESLLALDYPDFEVIVVDDGSTDDTYARACRFARAHRGREIRVYRKPNGGKWSAHNYAFRRCRGELILCLDADSRLAPDALRQVVARMDDPTIDAVAGQIRVRNRVNILTRLQALEYILANGMLRMAQGASGTVLVVPGPIGLFRRSTMEEVFLRFGEKTAPSGPGAVAGPFEADTFAEDFDLSATILALGGRIAYEPDAVSHTKAPDWPHGLLNQRYRWCRGTLQVLRKFFRRTRRPPGVRRLRVLLWIVTTYLFEVLVVPAFYLIMITTLLVLLMSGQSLMPLVIWGAAFLALNVNAAAFFLLVHRDRLNLLFVLPLFGLYHGFMINSAWAIAIIDELRGAKMRW